MPNVYMPISISLKDRPCLVVGGGDVAVRKIDTLLDYECQITVIAPHPVDKIEYFASKGILTLEKREYRTPEASSYGIVISASNDSAVNRKVCKDCKNAGVPVNIVDDPLLCDFIFPAVLKRDCLTVAVSTDGKAPFLAAQLRLILENVFPERWKKIAMVAATFRKKVQQRWQNNPNKKVESFNRFFNADWDAILNRMSEEDIEQELNRLLEC